QVLPASPALLLELADTVYASEEHGFERQILIARAEDLLATSRLPREEKSFLGGLANELTGHYIQAVSQYQLAVKYRPNSVSWRLRLATLYHRRGLLDEARQEARWCVRLDPEHPAARDLLTTIHREQMLQTAGP
ncbi:MAG: hypothetical protein KY475_15740, partial [Planctomycetes bacterium]|nr:hypothetical protein [Planctomycetota bacterium]